MAIRAGAVLLALVIAGLFLSLTGKDPIEVFMTMFDGAFGSKLGLSESLVRTVPLLLCGLGIALASRMQLWNVGAEGQFYMGGLAATFVALHWSTAPPLLLLPLMAVAGMLGGGLWCLLAGLGRAYLGTNETITTLLLNYVAINLVAFFVYGPWKDPKGSNFPLTPRFSDNATLPLLWGRVHVGLIAALVIAVILWQVLWHTKWGYEIRVIGESHSAARYARISIVKNILAVMFTAGALAGLAGMMEVSGLLHRLQKDISPGYGYTAIIIAYLAQLNPVALVVVSFLFGGLQAGAYSVQSMGVPLATAYMIQGVILFVVLGAELLTRNQLKLVFTKKEAAVR
jgi:ABC-type uncharacterized transport system permease subunit